MPQPNNTRRQMQTVAAEKKEKYRRKCDGWPMQNTNSTRGRCRCHYFSRRPRWLISLPFRLNAQKISARLRSHSRTKTQRGRVRARMGGCVLQEEEMMRRWHGNPMRADWYCGFGPWTQHRLYSINTALGELIIVVYVVLKLLILLFTTPMTNFIFDIY